MSLISRANSKPSADRIDRQQARSLVRQIIDADPHKPIDAAQVLQRHPELKPHHSCVIDLAYEEFCRHREQGADVRPSVFVRKFDGIQQSLFRVIEFDQVLQDNPSLIEHVPEDRWPVEGDVFCGFELREQLGRGALSRVFRAIQPDLGNRQVVVKVCLQGQREADFLGKLDHPSIARVYSIHTAPDSGLAVICMPFVTRVTLHEVAEWLTRQHRHPRGQELRERVALENGQPSLLAGRKPSLPTTADDSFSTVLTRWGMQLAEALHYAHSLNILHCDVKPGNVLVNSDLSVSLLDFNLASDAADEISLAGGTLPYMAPEQIRLLLNEKQSDASTAELRPATDVFGLSATLWHLATGEPPFGVAVDAKSRAAAARQMLKRQTQGIPERAMAEARRILPRQLVSVLSKGLQTNPALRFESAEAMARALRRQLPSRFWNRRNLLSVLGLAATVTAAAFYLRTDLDQVTRQGRVLIANREFEAATELMAAYPAHPECQFLELVSRTCALPSMTTDHLNSAFLSHDLLDTNRQWSAIADEWEAYAQTGSFPAESRANFGLVNLEFGTSDALKRAQTAFDQAIAAGVRSASVDRAHRLLQAWSAPEKPSSLKLVRELAPQIVQSGSRGEVLTLIRTLMLMPETLRRSPPFAESVEFVCDALESPVRPRAESEMIGPLVSRVEGPLAARAARIWRQRTRTGDFNRLAPVLVLPHSTGLVRQP